MSNSGEFGEVQSIKTSEQEFRNAQINVTRLLMSRNGIGVHESHSGHARFGEWWLGLKDVAVKSSPAVVFRGLVDSIEQQNMPGDRQLLRDASTSWREVAVAKLTNRFLDRCIELKMHIPREYLQSGPEEVKEK